jgi:hypothetical protein
MWAPRPATAPSGAIDRQTRVPPAVACIDAVSALTTDAACNPLLAKMVDIFSPRRFDLYRAFHLYDTAGKRALSVPSFVAAIVSAGFKVTLAQADALKAALRRAAGAPGMPLPNEADVFIDYEAFLDAVVRG